MTRTSTAILSVTVLLALSACGVGTDFPIVSDPAITVTAVTDSSITITWTPAANEPKVGRGYQYDIYTSVMAITSAADLDTAKLQLSGTADDFGEEAPAASLTGLNQGTGYHINIAAVNTRTGDSELYDDFIGITTGGTSISDTYTGSTPYFNHSVPESGASSAVEYTLDVGATARDVFLVFSNPASNPVARPEVMLGTLADVSFATTPALASSPDTRAARSVTPSGPVILRDRPEIAGWQPPAPRPASRSIVPPPPPSRDTVGQTDTFYDDSTINSIDATCKRVVTDSSNLTTLNIWVQDAEWANGTITQTMVDALADAFLSDGPDNDVYDWVSNVYDDQWGPVPPEFSYLIPDTDDITILLWDIGSDGPGGVVGYFWAKDSYQRIAGNVPYSNERVMFYLDSQSFGAGSGTWSIDDYWPSEMVLTLAHEFQHMIHYYQRDVLQGTDTETWLNEMMSMVTEDLVGRKLYDDPVLTLDVLGPRGVLPSWGLESGGAGDPGNTEGRLPLYNAYPSLNLTAWLSGDDVLKSYSTAYAFGAFLARTAGGAALFAAMMDSPYSVSESVISGAIEAIGGGAGTTMADLLWKWGVSVLLSDDGAAPSAVQMNTGAWMRSTVGSTDYYLGSINDFNYLQDGSLASGPVIHTSSSYTIGEMEGVSTIFYRLAESRTGTLTAVLLVPTGVDFTVVVK